ncbi:globin [Sulfurospirillum oryzae]|uniref:globin domain-containing protein n=1 Tax=Sulfurospirillum oryzae TaxID=2976535 RepID=UPI0021E7B358|nr:globin [Sulfurospirillum oryzae]
MCHGHHFMQKPATPKKSATLKWSSSNVKVSLPPILFPSYQLLEKVGAENIFNIVLHHHRLLQKSSIAHLYPTDDAHFLEGVTKASHFIIEALGGEKVYTPNYGPPAMCRTHAPFVIDDESRAVWLMAYKQILHDLHFPKELIEEFWNWIEPFSLRMVNRRSHETHLKRFLYEDMKAEFGLI